MKATVSYNEITIPKKNPDLLPLATKYPAIM